MCCSCSTLTFLIYIVAVYAFGAYLRYLAFEDYFECFACKELNFKNQTYDYIVVGSGSAGSIVARRLAEDKNVKILLLEAGSCEHAWLQIPAVAVMVQNSPHDWQYRTVPQKKACLGLDNKVSHWPMGKVLGGTAMLNNMIYVRGHLDDFSRWFKDYCNYNYTIDVLPYFEKLEEGNDQSSVLISDPPYKSNISDYFLQAGICLGFDISDGVNTEPGFSSPKVTMYKGQRWTPYHQLTQQKTPQLTIVTNSLVEKVLLNSNLEAQGVKYIHLEEAMYAKASKGVILSAGVIGTPKILMLSGIGPKKHLQDLKIPLKLDLPVGDNLQDHVTTGLDLVTLDFPPNMGITQMMSPWSAFDYFLRSSGPWTTPGCETLGFFNSEKTQLPELQFMIFPVGVASDKGLFLRSLTGISDGVFTKYFAEIGRPSISILPVVLHPKSRGTVRLKNRNPLTPPIIDPKYLTDPYDLDILIQGVEMIKEFVATPPMKRLGATLYNKTFPGCETFTFDTRPYWECYVRHLTLTAYHPVGTCKLGEVVADNYRVKGTTKLYVVDGSVLPDLPSGNPNGAIMMMAERASQLIKSDCWPSQRKCCSEEIFTGECQC